MYLNNEARIIYWTSKGQDEFETEHTSHNLTKGHVFSHGTNFRQIMHYKQHGQTADIARYLENLYGLQVDVAECNKPLYLAPPGKVLNSAASIFHAANQPLIMPKTLVAHNEPTFGFVPHAGATFYFSRMKGEIGTFLAITGMPLHRGDTFETGSAEGVLVTQSNFMEKAGTALCSWDKDYDRHVQQDGQDINFFEDAAANYMERRHQL